MTAASVPRCSKPKPILGVKFTDGIEDFRASAAPQAAALSFRPSAKFGDSSSAVWGLRTTLDGAA
jgi:hypothetical protein